MLKMRDSELDLYKARIYVFKSYGAFGREEIALFAQVCLAPDCPEFIVKAVRREYRKAYHPDRKVEGEKRAAEDTFKRMENVFAKIQYLREQRR